MNELEQKLPSTFDCCNIMDKTGAAASLLCAVHCAAMPVCLHLLPVAGIRLLASPLFEWGMVGASLTLGSCAVLSGYRRHRSPRAFFYLVAGALLLLAARFSHAAAETPCCQPDTPLLSTAVIPSVFGGIFIMTAHFQNLCLSRNLCTSKANCAQGYSCQVPHI